MNNYIVIEKQDKELLQKLISVGASFVEYEGEYRMHLLEAAYLAEKGILKMDYNKLIEQAKKLDHLAEYKYRIIKNLWSRAYISRMSLENGSHDGDYIRVHAKGFRPGEDRTRYIIKFIEPSKFTHSEMQESLEFAGRLRKELFFAYVEKEDVHFIKMSRAKFE